MRKVLSKKIKTTSMEDLLSGVPMNAPEEIDIDLIRPFKDHPFKVLDDDKMETLVESVLQNGIITPVIVRPMKDGSYEMISGHRRMHAARKAKLGFLQRYGWLTDDEVKAYSAKFKPK